MKATESAVVITVSDSCFAGEREDASGPAVAAVLRSHGFSVGPIVTVPDEVDAIASALREQGRKAALVVTTGGTGIARRDVTPEATRMVCDRILDGFAERMRSEGLKQTPLAPLSRAVCGVLRTAVPGEPAVTGEPAGKDASALVINLPGSPAGAVASLQAVLGLIPHALALLAGNTEH